MTHARLLRMMSSQEIGRWEYLERIDPFGQLRDDYRIAKLASDILMGWGVKKLDKTSYRPEDLLLVFKVVEPQEPQTVEEIQRVMGEMFAEHNKLFATKGRAN